MSDYNMDTELLAAKLAEAYAQAILDRVNGTGRLDQDAFDHAWYRVAERAKELRA